MQAVKALPSISVQYVPAQKKYFWPEHQAGMDDLEKQGYFKVEKPGERLLMNKPASVNVIFKFFGTPILYDAKNDVLKLYGLQKISEKSAKRFERDVLNGNIVITMKNGKMQFVKLEESIQQSDGIQLGLGF